jgi:hypothetical protein
MAQTRVANVREDIISSNPQKRVDYSVTHSAHPYILHVNVNYLRISAQVSKPAATLNLNDIAPSVEQTTIKHRSIKKTHCCCMITQKTFKFFANLS